MKKELAIWLFGKPIALVGFLLLAGLAAACAREGEEGATPITTGTAAAPTGTAAAPTGEVPGITPTEIILGQHAPLSGGLGAVYAQVPSAQRAYYEYVNKEKGGVCGRKIVLKAEDDQYDPAKAMEATRKLVEQDKIFAMVASLGTAPHSAVWDYLNERGIPDLWVMSGAHKWGADPKAHPWTVGFLPDYFVEFTILGKYISESFPGKKVGIVYQNDDFGRDELAGLKNGLDPTKNQFVTEQSYEATTVDIRSQVANAREAGAEVMLCACLPGYTAQAIKGANRLGWKPQWLVGYVNSDPIIFQYASPQDMEGTISLQANKLFDWTDDPVVGQAP